MYEGHLLATLVCVLVSVHIWAIRAGVGIGCRRAALSLLRWISESKQALSTPADLAFEQCWQEAKIQQFKSVTAFATHAAGIVLLVFLVCTDVLSKVHAGKVTELPLCVIFTANYACLLMNYVTRDSATWRRIDLFYAVFMLTALTSLLLVEKGPFFFILRGNDALAQGMLALVVMDIRRSSVGGAVYAICCCVSYMWNVSAFHPNLLFEHHTQIFFFWEFALWVFSCGVAYTAEYWLKGSMKAKFETEDVHDALDRVLSALCDAVLHLNTDFLIQNPTAKLLHMLDPDAGGDNTSLQNHEFIEFIPSANDRLRFMDFAAASHLAGSGGPAAKGQLRSPSSRPSRPAAATHVQLQDLRGHIFRVELFHTHLQGSASLVHLIGIRYAENRDAYSDEVQHGVLEFERSTSPLFLPRHHSGAPEDMVPAGPIASCAADRLLPPSMSAAITSVPGAVASAASAVIATASVAESSVTARVEVDSALGAPTDGGRTVAQEPWRCPRCRATRQDWGDIISVISGAEENQSVLCSVAPPPRAHTPPPAGLPPVAAGPSDQQDRQAIGGQLSSLYQWAPDICRDVLTEIQSTYSVVHTAATSLEVEERSQYIREVQSQVLELCLVGSRLEQRWPGLRSMWCHVISYVTGAQPVPLRALLEARPTLRPVSLQLHTIVAWQLPGFSGTSISPSWWGLGPQGIYDRLRTAVVKRVATSRRGPGGPPLS